MSKDLKNLVQKSSRFTWVERFTGIFAFLNIVVISIFAAGCTASLGCMIIGQIFSLFGKDTEILWYLCLTCCVGTSIALTFSVMLFHGMYQKKPNFVLAYFIFGAIINIIIVCSITPLQYVVVKLDQSIQDIYNDNFYVVIGVCVAYAVVLVMVGCTYVLMRLQRYKPMQTVD